jgi:hypothetical protein
MKLVADGGVRSARLEQLQARGCSHCGGPTGRLTQDHAGERRRLTAPRRSVDALGHAGIARRAAFRAGAE